MSNEIHFPIISSLDHDISVLNVARTRGVIKKYKFDWKVTYNIIRSYDYDNCINAFEIGKTVLDIQELNHIVQLINNYKNNKPLLDNVSLGPKLEGLINKVNKDYKDCHNIKCVALSLFRSFVFINIYIALLIKRLNPNVELMIGGPHVEMSYNTLELLKFTKIFDYIIKGDIEIALIKYLQNRLDKSKVYELYFDLEKDYICPIYTPLELKIFKSVIFETTRGCPNRCAFCAGGHGKFRKIPLLHVFNTFDYYNQDSDYQISLNENTLNYSKNRIRTLTDYLIKTNNKVNKSSNICFRHLDPDIIEKLDRSKFRYLYIGLDTFANDTLNDNMGVSIKKDDNFVRHLDEMYKRNFYLIHIFLVYNCPGETDELFLQNFERVKYLRNRFPNQNKFKIDYLPYFHSVGSRMFNSPDRFNIRYEYWNEMDCYDPDLNKIIKRTPKYYYIDIDQNEVNRRYKLVSEFLKTLKSNMIEKQKGL